MNTIENPFINTNITINYYDDYGTNIELTQSNISKYFKYIFILTKKNKETIPSIFYNKQVPQHIFETVSSNLVIHKVSVKVLKNKRHFNNIVIMTSEQLNPYNIFNYELINKNIVLPILNIEYTNMIQYLEQYDSSNTLSNIYNIKLLNLYFNININDTFINANNFITNMIINLNESDYWTNYNNCLINITYPFVKRKMNFHSARITNRPIAKLIDSIFDKDDKYINEDYIKELDYDKTKYVDISMIKTIYRLGSKSEFTKEDINQLFTNLTEKQQFLLFSNLMVSKKYCHLVVNNSTILKLMNNVINNFAPLFRYLLSYAWIRLYFDECIKKSFVNTDDEFIFDIETASLLPVFPFSHLTPKQNPYMPILVSDLELKPHENIGGIPNYNIILDDNKLLNCNGICNLEEFKFRLNIFSTNNPNNDIFADIDFKRYDACITGSIMSACLQKYHPLMTLFNNSINSIKNNNISDKNNNISINESTNTSSNIQFNNIDNFINYFNEYYAEADIDIMFKAKDDFTFIKNVYDFYDRITINLKKLHPAVESLEPTAEIICNKIGYLFVSKEFIINNIILDEEVKNTDKLNYILEHINDDEIKELFKPYYEQLKIEKYNDFVKDYTDEEVVKLKEDYPDIFSTDECEFKIFINKYYKNKKTCSKNNEVNKTDDNGLDDNLDDETTRINKEFSDTEPEVEIKDDELDNKKDCAMDTFLGEIRELDLVYTYKYKIISTYLNHPLELFPIKYNDFFNVISRFHLPCVRGYYNGDNVYLTPSCISAHLTYMNIDYKYMVGSKDPFDIISKYRMRGFGTWLNNNEKQLFIKYTQTIPFWNNLYTIDNNTSTKEAYTNITGTISLNSKLYHPRLYNIDHYHELPMVSLTNRYNDIEYQTKINISNIPITNLIITKFRSINISEINYNNLNSIDTNGNIIPLKKWVINTTWDIYSNEYLNKDTSIKKDLIKKKK